MYSRSLDPTRITSPLPNHYGGSAFRSDGTPMPIPVKRELDLPREGAPEHAAKADPPLLPEGQAADSLLEEKPTEEAPTSARGVEEDEAPFFRRLTSGLFPRVRSDDVLLVLLLILLSGESGNEDILLILLVLLLGK